MSSHMDAIDQQELRQEAQALPLDAILVVCPWQGGNDHRALPKETYEQVHVSVCNSHVRCRQSWAFATLAAWQCSMRHCLSTKVQ